MRIHLTPRKGARRLAGMAVAVSAVTALGLVQSASAQTTSQGAPAAAAAPITSRCFWLPTPAALWVTDKTNNPVGLIGGIYGRPGSVGVAYRVNGQFTYTTTMSFTVYDNLDDIPAANYVINDRNIIPDPGSVNPFVPGARVEGKPRHYTAWIWPNNVPVPAGLKNVILYPTKPAFPGTGAARWGVAFRQYHPQPGHPTLAGLAVTKVTAVSAANPSRPVRCPLRTANAYNIQLGSTYAHLKYWGPVQNPPEPTTGNKIYFMSAPAVIFLGLDGYPGHLPQSCLQYMVAGVSPNKISVITQHKVPTYFNNDLVTPASIMKDYQIRYQSFGVNYFTLNTRLYNSLWTNTDDASYTSKGEWVMVYLPAEPRLTPGQIAQVRSLARAQHFNVIQLPPRSRTLPGSLLPYPTITLRQKAVSSSFPYSNLALPCWSQNHSYKTWTQQSSPAFFAKYASSRVYNGPYYVDGVKLTFAQFIRKYS